MTKPAPQHQPNNPLHGVTLEQVVTELYDHYGWQHLGVMIDIRCFNADPSIKSSLKFLRKTPWAREKVEGLWLDTEFRRPEPSETTPPPAATTPSPENPDEK